MHGLKHLLGGWVVAYIFPHCHHSREILVVQGLALAAILTARYGNQVGRAGFGKKVPGRNVVSGRGFSNSTINAIHCKTEDNAILYVSRMDGAD
jgi:hypothetical protein